MEVGGGTPTSEELREPCDASEAVSDAWSSASCAGSGVTGATSGEREEAGGTGLRRRLAVEREEVDMVVECGEIPGRAGRSGPAAAWIVSACCSG